MAGHKYWRLEFSIATGSQVGLTHIELLETRYGPTIFRPDTGYTLTGSGAAPMSVLDDSVNSPNGWITLGTSAWLEITTTTDVWIDAVAIWRNMNGVSPTTVRALRSDDGTTWTQAWIHTGIVPNTNSWEPYLALNPTYVVPPDTTSLVLRFGSKQYDLDAGGAVFSDVGGSTPIADGQRVARVNNPTGFSGANAHFQQASSPARPVWHQSGVLGLPYMTLSGPEWFESVAFTQPSGITGIRPWAAVAVVNNTARTGVPSFWGGIGPSFGGKGGFCLRPDTVGQEIQVFKQGYRLGNYTSSTRVISGGATAIAGGGYIGIDGSLARSGNVDNPTSTAITQAAVLWRGDGAVGSNPFVGDVYRLLVLDGGSPIDIWLASRYMMGKYVEGFAPPPSPTSRRRMPYVVN